MELELRMRNGETMSLYACALLKDICIIIVMGNTYRVAQHKSYGCALMCHKCTFETCLQCNQYVVWMLSSHISDALYLSWTVHRWIRVKNPELRKMYILVWWIVCCSRTVVQVIVHHISAWLHPTHICMYDAVVYVSIWTVKGVTYLKCWAIARKIAALGFFVMLAHCSI